MNKRGLEFSVNFIIILVLAIVTLFMGIVIFRIMFTGGTELEQQVSERTRDEINRLLMRGEDFVILPDFYQEMSIGDVHVFGLGIRNTGPDQSFTVYIEPKQWAVDTDNKQSGPVDARGWYFEKIGPFTVPNNELEVISLPIRIGSTAKKGWTYIFNVRVEDKNGQIYGDLQKIYVDIK
ncbi:hypothetical protein KY311_01455 [Candidatus Woesearchaeota archaeon]|nr:hypothetical protein [Candidatus Woesearchaeota archaeon]MBW3016974.1 hypothetical protein [Candidatus Woesearchaeota archaeon]